MGCSFRPFPRAIKQITRKLDGIMTLPWMAAKILLRPVAELRPHAGNKIREDRYLFDQHRQARMGGAAERRGGGEKRRQPRVASPPPPPA